MYEPCFNTLRTKNQLGYTVYTQNYDTNGVIGLGIIVEFQQNKFRYSNFSSDIQSSGTALREKVGAGPGLRMSENNAEVA